MTKRICNVAVVACGSNGGARKCGASATQKVSGRWYCIRHAETARLIAANCQQDHSARIQAEKLKLADAVLRAWDEAGRTALGHAGELLALWVEAIEAYRAATGEGR